jgi:hypothetical protein
MDIKRFLQDPELLVQLCREVIDALDGAEDPQVREKEAQLREISRTIERLHKAGVPVPEVLRAEKTRLAVALGGRGQTQQALIRLATQFEDILKDIRSRLGSGGGGEIHRHKRATGYRSKSPKTRKQVYREHIIRALKTFGGRARVSDVLEEIGRQLNGKLLPGDLELRKDGRTVGWHNSVQWERLRMVKDGILRSGSPNGVWELADGHL